MGFIPVRYLHYLMTVGVVFSLTFSTQAQATSCSAIEVISSSLNVRTGHSTRNSKVGVIHKGERYIVSDTYGVWKKIWYDNKARWVYAKRYTKPITTSCGTVNTYRLNVRSGSSTYYRRVGSTYRNAKWAIIASSGSWKRIWYKSEARWVHGSYLNSSNDEDNEAIQLTSFKINQGATSTDSRYITTYSVVSGAASFYQISANESFNDTSWQSYSSQPAFTLSAGNGNKRVYFRVKNEDGRLSNTLYDDINLTIFTPATRTIDREIFFSKIKQTFGALRQSQEEGINFLLEKIETDEEPTLDNHSVWVKQAAYTLATIKHEVANTYQPITEYSNTTCRRYNGGCSYKGRGYVQLTHRYNYQKLSPIVGVDLVKYPLKALEPEISYRVTSYGMHHGTFTGRKLGNYINASKTDYWNSRRVVNGTDKATLIKGYANKFQSILEASAND